MSLPPFRRRDAEQVAWRTFSLFAVAGQAYLHLEHLEQGLPPENEAPVLPDWVLQYAEHVTNHSLDWERQLLEWPMGRVPVARVNQATWLVEEYAVMLWALGFALAPPMNEAVSPFAVLDQVLDFQETMARARLYEAESLERYAANVACWNLLLRPHAEVPAGEQMPSLDRFAAARKLRADLLPHDGPNFEVSENVEADGHANVSFFRLRGALWLMGEGPASGLALDDLNALVHELDRSAGDSEAGKRAE